MSLQVWLPLTGDLNNQGLSNITVTNNGATLNAAGKLGSCYSFDGSDDYIALTGNTFYNIIKGSNQPFSIAMWIYHADATRAILFGDFGLSGAINFNIELTTSHTLRFYWNGSPDVAPNTFVISQSTWAHAAFVYNGSSLQFYVNGELKYTWSGTLAAKTKSSGSYYLGRDSRTGTTVLNGRLNDFRLYDHALSVKEVEELARGLVVHYKLSDSYIEGTTNLFKANPCSGGSRWTASGNGVKIDWTSNAGDTYWYLDLASGVTLTEGATYTFSCKCSGIGSSTVMFRWCNLVGYEVYLQNGWNQYTFSMPATNITRPFFDDINRDTTLSNLRIYDFQLEAKDHATAYTAFTRAAGTRMCDCSGYKHHGTVIDLNASSSTARYTASSRFPESASSILIGNLSTIVPEGNFTFNVWFKKVTGEWSSMPWETIFGGPSGFELEAKLGSSTNAYIHPYNWGGGSTSTPNNYSIAYELDKWNMVTMTRSSSGTRFYLNGEFKVAGSTAGTIPSGNYFLGAWSVTTRQNFRGYMSDARIYATVLSDKQIMELYNETAAIDRSGALYVREVIE